MSRPGKSGSYPPPNPRTLPFEEPQPLRPLIPLRQPFRAEATPCIPVSAASHDAVPGYTRTSHVVPAAFPRSLPVESPLRMKAISGGKLNIKGLGDSLVEAKLQFETPEVQASRGMADVSMWNCVERYVRVRTAESDARNVASGITLFVTHATGFPRQIWEPTLAHLTSLINESSSGVRIDEIWSFESVQHGDSALLNEANLHDTFDWQDHTRDILNFLVNYLPDSPYADNLPATLNHVPRRERPHHRQIVGVGHSFGGTTLALAAITRPDLFQSLILVEPLIVPTSRKRGRFHDRLLQIALGKPQTFLSRQAAKEVFQKFPPTNVWDPAVRDVYVKHALMDIPVSASQMECNIPVRLKAHPFDEAVVYCEWTVPYEVWTEIETLDDSVALHWIMSESSAMTGGDAMTQRTVWRRPANSTNVRLPGVSHLIVHEAPKLLALEILSFLERGNEKTLARL